jgi:hypothetical protein
MLKWKSQIFRIQYFCYLWIQTCTTIFWLLTKLLMKVPRWLLTFVICSQLAIVYLRIQTTTKILVASYMSALSVLSIWRTDMSNKWSIKFNLAISFDFQVGTLPAFHSEVEHIIELADPWLKERHPTIILYDLSSHGPHF